MIMLLGVLFCLAATPPAAVQDNITVYFSPDGGCTEAIVNEIAGAKTSLDIQAYSFTSTPIAKAVHEAKDRGVKVRVILDKSQATAQYSSATYLFNANVPVWIDDKHAIAHNKIMLIDGRTIITGSFNFTKAAEEDNGENVLIIKNKGTLNRAYAENFTKHLAHSKPYERPKD